MRYIYEQRLEFINGFSRKIWYAKILHKFIGATFDSDTVFYMVIHGYIQPVLCDFWLAQLLMLNYSFNHKPLIVATKR